MTTREELAAVLLDVRKAYRLLADYQSALIALANEIASELGLTYYTAAYPNTPPRNYNTNPLGRFTGKNFLPMLGASHMFLKSAPGNEEPWHTPEAGDYVLDCRFISDTAELTAGNSGRVSAPAEAADSLLLLYLFHTTQTLPKGTNWYHNIWDQISYPEYDGEWQVYPKHPSVAAYRLTVSLADFADPTAAADAARRVREVLAARESTAK